MNKKIEQKRGRGRPRKKPQLPPPRGRNDNTYPSYEIAKQIARESGATSRKEYYEWHRMNKITHIPFDVRKVYRDKWEGWGVFLQTGNLFGQDFENVSSEEDLLPFWESVRFAQSLKLKSQAEWNEYCKNNTLPTGVPRNPKKWYPIEWDKYKSWKTWLGTDNTKRKHDITKQLEATQQVKKNAYGVLLWEMGDPNNVLTTFKTNTKMSINERLQTNQYRFLQAYDLSKSEDLEIFDNIINNNTSSWYGNTNKRLTTNWNQLKWDLDCQLLIFRL